MILEAVFAESPGASHGKEERSEVVKSYIR
jgi:hypothetical protein